MVRKYRTGSYCPVNFFAVPCGFERMRFYAQTPCWLYGMYEGWIQTSLLKWSSISYEPVVCNTMVNYKRTHLWGRGPKWMDPKHVDGMCVPIMRRHPSNAEDDAFYTPWRILFKLDGRPFGFGSPKAIDYVRNAGVYEHSEFEPMFIPGYKLQAPEDRDVGHSRNEASDSICE